MGVKLKHRIGSGPIPAIWQLLATGDPYFRAAGILLLKEYAATLTANGKGEFAARASVSRYRPAAETAPEGCAEYVETVKARNPMFTPDVSDEEVLAALDEIEGRDRLLVYAELMRRGYQWDIRNQIWSKDVPPEPPNTIFGVPVVYTNDTPSVDLSNLKFLSPDVYSDPDFWNPKTGDDDDATE